MKQLLILLLTIVCIGCTNTQPQQDQYFIDQQQMIESLNKEFFDFVERVEQGFYNKQPTNISYQYFKNRNVHTVVITDNQYIEDIKTPTSTINIVGTNNKITTTITNSQGVRVNTIQMPTNFIENKIALYNQQQSYVKGEN